MKKILKEKDIFYEAGHALCWCEFKEKGCPITKDDAKRDYFLSKKEILRIAKKIENLNNPH